MHFMKLTGNKVTLRTIIPDDFPVLYDFIYGMEQPEWKNWDAPYFPHKAIPYDAFVEQMTKKIANATSVNQLAIIHEEQLIGTVSSYWEFEPSRWLEAGIVIYVPDYWNGGFGTDALKLWVNFLFEQHDIARIGITTWSGNERMMRAAEKIGMQLEGRMRKCRYYNGTYYDSIRMGVLREEWNQLN
ncbi:GNAT family N-acetyltransferase [Bacillus sp. BGMRC 2118]|nr:GNAT family N-acetyltransferase [Bacillus sp. BGMRC 2118]